MEGASRCDDDVWADDAAAIIADVDDPFYYNTNGTWYVLNVAAAIRSLAGEGYGSLYQAEVRELLGILVGLAESGDGVNGAIQETAYAVMAFKTVGFSMNRHANNLARWLSDMQEEGGGWLESDDNEYAEINGEAVRAMAMTVGRGNVPGVKSNVPPKLVATLTASARAKSPSELSPLDHKNPRPHLWPPERPRQGRAPHARADGAGARRRLSRADEIEPWPRTARAR